MKIPKTITQFYPLPSLILLPMTNYKNLWHTMHHLFIAYKYIINNNIQTKNCYFLGLRNKSNLKQFVFLDFFLTSLGLDKQSYEKIHQNFISNKGVQTEKLDIVNECIHFDNEPLFDSFKQNIFNNYNIKINEKKNITFILRKHIRVIKNLTFLKKNLNDVNFIYLEDYSFQSQIEIIKNSRILIGVHGAGLTWGIFMDPKSLLIELCPNKSRTDNYKRWCKLANIHYKRLSVPICSKNKKNFRNCNVKIKKYQLELIEKLKYFNNN